MISHNTILSKSRKFLLKYGVVLFAALLSLLCVWQIDGQLSQLRTALWETWMGRAAGDSPYLSAANYTSLAHKLHMASHLGHSLLIMLGFTLWTARFGNVDFSTHLKRVGWAVVALIVWGGALFTFLNMAPKSLWDVGVPLVCLGVVGGMLVVARRDLSRLSLLLLLPLLYSMLRSLWSVVLTWHALSLLLVLWCVATLIVSTRRSALNSWFGRTMLATATALFIFTGWLKPQVNYELAHYYTYSSYMGAMCGQDVARWLYRLEGDHAGPALEIEKLGARQYFFGPYAGDKGRAISDF